jgi:hypothetical protein
MSPGQKKEGRQQGLGGDFSGIYDLRDGKDLNARLLIFLSPGRGIGQDGVGGT